MLYTGLEEKLAIPLKWVSGTSAAPASQLSVVAQSAAPKTGKHRLHCKRHLSLHLPSPSWLCSAEAIHFHHLNGPRSNAGHYFI